MKIEIPDFISNDLNDSLNLLSKALRQTSGLAREEEHQLIAPDNLANNVFISAAITILIKQKQNEGYLIKTPASFSSSKTFFFNQIDNPNSDWLAVKKNIDKLTKGRQDLQNIFLYASGELLDNIRDHSHSSLGVINFLPTVNGFSLAAADTGISIPNSFRQAGISLNNNCEALKKATQGISTKISEQRGTGLPSIKRIVLNGFRGELIIVSADSLLKVNQQEEVCQPSGLFWQGTIVYLSGIFPKETISLYDYLT